MSAIASIPANANADIYLNHLFIISFPKFFASWTKDDAKGLFYLPGILSGESQQTKKPGKYRACLHM
jgi:hypothetical protein